MDRGTIENEFKNQGYIKDKAERMGDAFQELADLGSARLREVFGDDNRYLTFNGESFQIKIGFRPDIVLKEYQAYMEIAQMPEQDRTEILSLIQEGLYCPTKAIARFKKTRTATASIRNTHGNSVLTTLDQ